MKRKETHQQTILNTPASALSNAHMKAMRLLLNNSQLAFIIINTELEVVLFSKAASEMAWELLNIELHEGRSILEMVPPERVQAVKEVYQSVLSGQQKEVEKKYVRQDRVIYKNIKYQPAFDEFERINGVLITAEDITASQLKQQELKLSEERWRFAQEGSNQGMWDWNIQTGEVYFSPSWKKLFGFTDSDDINHISHWEQRIHPEDKKPMAQNLNSHAKSSDPHFESVYRFMAADGSYRWLLARGIVLEKDEAGMPARMIGTHTDITDIRLLEENYKILFDANPLPSWTYHLETGQFIDVNDAALQLYGYTRTDFLQLTLSQLIAEEPGLMLPHLSKKQYQHHRKKNGEVIMVSLTGDIIQQKDACVALVIAEDVTQKLAAERQLQQSEEQYRALFHSTPLPVWIYEKATLRILAVNEAALLHYGYTKAEFQQLTLFDLHHDSQHDMLLQRIAKEMSNEKIVEKKWRHRKKNGDEIYVDLNSAAISYNGIEARLVIVHDVTAMVKAEQQLQISNTRFELATKAASEALWEWDIEADKTYISPVYEIMFGFKIDLQDNYLEWHHNIHPDDAPEVISSFYATIENPEQNHWQQEYRYLKSDGSYVYVADHCVILRNEQGKAVKAVGAMQDISKRKEAEQAIIRIKERYELASRATSDALYDWNMVTGELTWSDNITVLFDYPTNRVTLKNWEQHVHPDDEKEVIDSLYKTINDPTASTWKKEYRFQHANGNYKHVVEKGFIIRNQYGKAVRMIGALQDITEIKQKQLELALSKERFDAVLKATSDFIWDWNLEENTFYLDPYGLKKVLGIENEQEILNEEMWLQRLHPSDRQKGREVIDKMMNGTIEQNFEREYRFLRNDGTYAYIHDRGVVLRNQEGKPIRLIGAAQDITLRKKLEQKLLQKELEKQRIISKATIDTQEQERTEIGRELHDNVNQVLTTTKLYLELSQATPGMRDEMIQKANNNIIYVINEIRQLSRSLMNPSIGDLGLLDSLNDLIENVNATKKLAVTLKASRQLEPLLCPDQKLMVYRIMQEALNNALRHSGATQVLISIKKNGKNIDIVIEDNGKGFNMATIKKGMGLKNIQNRVYLANGTFEISSTPGDGCTLTVQFPYFKKN